MGRVKPVKIASSHAGVRILCLQRAARHPLGTTHSVPALIVTPHAACLAWSSCHWSVFKVSLDVPALLPPPGAENFGGALRPSPDTLWADICRFLAVSSTQAVLIARGFGMHRAPMVASKGFQSAPRRCRSTGLCRHQMDPRGCPSEDALWRPGPPCNIDPSQAAARAAVRCCDTPVNKGCLDCGAERKVCLVSG